MRIVGGEVLRGGALAPGDLHIEGAIVERADGPDIDARGLLALPGIVDLHGDSFERQVQPRPGVNIPASVALADTEAQLLANGITTAFHGVTLSWEQGLRGAGAWRAWLDALDAHRPRAACDMRLHLRWEAFNVDALDMAMGDIAAGRVHLLAYNDHTPSIVRRMGDPAEAIAYSKRSGQAPAAFAATAQAAAARGGEVEGALDKIGAAARAAGLPIASHDDDTPATRVAFRARGARICEFPMTEAVARAARHGGDWVAMGAPNAMRGGSHLGWAGAADMVRAGLCDVLTSDYYYPAMLQAAFALERRGMQLARAWATVSASPAMAGGLADRGRLDTGARADIVLVERAPLPRIVMTIADGRVAWASAAGFQRMAVADAPAGRRLPGA